MITTLEAINEMLGIAYAAGLEQRALERARVHLGRTEAEGQRSSWLVFAHGAEVDAMRADETLREMNEEERGKAWVYIA